MGTAPELGALRNRTGCPKDEGLYELPLQGYACSSFSSPFPQHPETVRQVPSDSPRGSMLPGMIGVIVRPYYIRADDTCVTAWSTACIPFPPYKPHDWRADFRDDLRAAIARLPSRQGKVLSAAYRSPISEGADLENLLIYNIFDARLSSIARNGLIFERFYHVSRECPVPLSSQALCQYEYRLADEESSSLEEQSGRELAFLSFELPPRVPEGPTSVWYAAKKGHITRALGDHREKPWGISLAIRVPPSSRITCSNIVKPLIDGITSALHYHSGLNIKELSERLDRILGLGDSTSMKPLLLNNTNALFGTIDLLCCHGKNVQWNPQDGYCTYCSMRCFRDLPGTRVEVTARIFDIDQREVV